MVQPIGPLARLEALYAEIPAIACQRKCRECCGPVIQAGSITPLEHSRIADVPPSPVNSKDFMACSMLDGATGLCRVYDRRPLICRLWGTVENMICPFGCRPERYLTDAEARDLIRRVEQIGGQMDHEGAAIIRTVAPFITQREP